MAQEGGQERTEEATPKRLREAREKGQIARSRELTTFSLLFVSGIGIYLMGGKIIESLLSTMRDSFQPSMDKILNSDSLPKFFLSELTHALMVVAPLLMLLVVVALLAPMALGGWSFSPDALSVKLERVSPLKGIKRIFSLKSVVELVKALAKFGLVAIVAILFMWSHKDQLIVLSNDDIQVGLRGSGEILVWAFLIISSPLLLVVAIDVPFQLWDHAKQLRMSRQEIKDENKETEGNPEVRARVRNIQREMARKRMMAEVPRADVIITNPTHYAVAVKYDQDKMRAPIVLAKGKDLVAAQIRSIAHTYKIPVVSAPALSRSIYHSTPLNKEIPTGLYMAVAQVLAYVYQLRAKGYAHFRQDPRKFDDVPIPDDLRKDS
jgi:flagellar biosynthetic protein FlhB